MVYSPAFRKSAPPKAASGARLQSDADLLQQLVAEIGSQRPHWQAKHPQLKTHEKKPRRYYWTELDAAAEVAAAEGVADPQAECTPVNEAVGEHALYPVLADYLRSEELGVWAMRINERRSSNRQGSGGNEWLHPDLVGLEDLTMAGCQRCASMPACWANRVLACGHLKSSCCSTVRMRAKVFSGGVQFILGAPGLLVAERVEGDGALKELRMLSAAHGIGLIQLDRQSIRNQVLIPARERPSIDWEMCHRLAAENPDFMGFLAACAGFTRLAKCCQTSGDKSAARLRRYACASAASSCRRQRALCRLGERVAAWAGCQTVRTQSTRRGVIADALAGHGAGGLHQVQAHIARRIFLASVSQVCPGSSGLSGAGGNLPFSPSSCCMAR